MRLARLVPLAGLILAFSTACGDDSKGDPPKDAAGAGGENDLGGQGGGGSGGSSAGKPSAGTENEPGGASGAGGAGGEGAATDGGSSMGGEGGARPEPVDCSKLATPPAEVEILSGFKKSEDFAFDEFGNYVGVDDDSNLVRISKEGQRQLWAPNIGYTAGMAMLPDGSVIIADVGNGALKRVYPNGGSEVVIGGLLYPNGLDIGPDGFVYVAENNAGRVRRVNPDNGEFTIVAMGLEGANGVAVTDDPGLLYVGSFEGSGVYKVQIANPGELGVATVFARPNGSHLAEPTLACPDQMVGKDCETTTGRRQGTCQQLANVVDCVPASECDGKAEGEACSNGNGTCQQGACITNDPCSSNPNGPGCCQGIPKTGGGEGGTSSQGCCGFDCNAGGEDGVGGSGAIPAGPCDGLKEGDACSDPPFVQVGECVDFGFGKLACQPPSPCKGLKAGDACINPNFGAGVCTDYGGFLECELPNPCDGKPDGEACEYFDFKGTCEDGYCQQDPCDGAQPGQSCWSNDGGQGVCVGPEGGPFECIAPCSGKDDGDACMVGQTAGQCFKDLCALACTADTLGRPCVRNDELGYCNVGENGPTCETGGGPGGPGGIDGLGVDACGFVYASEYTLGNVWRISPTGEIEKLADLPSGWIPNIKWGRGIGGFDKDIMYVADRDEGRLFGISVGVPGATEYYDIGAKR